MLVSLDTSHTHLNESSQAVARALRRALSDELIAGLDRVLQFDGWHRWKPTSLAHPTTPTRPTFTFTTDTAELKQLLTRIAQGGIGDPVIGALAAHLSTHRIDLGLSRDNLAHPGSQWAHLMQFSTATATAASSYLVATLINNDLSDSLGQSLAHTALVDINHAHHLASIAPHLDDHALESVTMALSAPIGHHRVPGVDPVAERISLHAILEQCANRPRVARVIIDDTDRLSRLVTNPQLSPEVIESLGHSAITLTGAAPLLQRLVTIHAEHGELTTGGVRIATSALIYDLDSLARTIDLPMVRGQVPAGAIDIGTRDQVEALLADIINDRPSQAALGVALNALRHTRIETAIDNITLQPHLDFTSTLAGQLADVSDLSTTIDRSAHSAHEAELMRRSEVFGHINLGVSIAGIAATVAAPVIGSAASITISGSRRLAYLVETVTADNTPPERITELVNMTTMMSVLGHLANTPTVHQELHLVTVEPELWNEISRHVETFSAATTTVEKAGSYGDVMQLSGQSVELTSFINRLNVLIGG